VLSWRLWCRSPISGWLPRCRPPPGPWRRAGDVQAPPVDPQRAVAVAGPLLGAGARTAFPRHPGAVGGQGHAHAIEGARDGAGAGREGPGRRGAQRPGADAAAHHRTSGPDRPQVGVLTGRGDVHQVGTERGGAVNVHPPGQQGLRVASQAQQHTDVGLRRPGQVGGHREAVAVVKRQAGGNRKRSKWCRSDWSG